MQTHILGFPRIGKNRELKKALELYWKKEITLQNLQQTGSELRKQHWKIQKDSGLSYVTTGDFSFYDHVLDVSMMIGAVPERFKISAGESDLDVYFKMARGDAFSQVSAMEMTKWFDTNYHYIVPELSDSTVLKFSGRDIIDQTCEAVDAGYDAKPVLLGPVTYLSLSKSVDGFDKWLLADKLGDIYVQVIAELSSMCRWVQVDEPILCADMELEAAEAFKKIYKKLNSSPDSGSILLTTYFDNLDDNADLALNSGCTGLHIDLIRGGGAAEHIVNNLPDFMTLSVGVVDGRNIWTTDLVKARKQLENIKEKVPHERLMIGSSCSLLHSPVDITSEAGIDSELKTWMSFAVQKCRETALLGAVMSGGEYSREIEHNQEIIRSRNESSKVHSAKVKELTECIDSSMLKRKSPYSKRKKEQGWLNLPLFPTTTIGSFPQTDEIRNQRRKFRNGEVFIEDYDFFIRNEIKKIIRKQEELNLDVLVHGEPERNDMVEYFGQKMHGFCFTQNGWVQSYGSRCVKPPVIYGDVFRRGDMTVDWITYAQSLTGKPVKGMLTGPVTILCWSFVRDDIEKAEVCRQIALAVREEVMSLEKAGINIIQIDEAAFSEGMPVKHKDRNGYFRWATDAFRLASSGVQDKTQIHTHMCYSEFNEIIEAIADMDADVISIESSRSGMVLLDAFNDFEYPRDIGPGVYDIHSPRVPSVEEIKGLISSALEKIPAERLWINPDCGLKTREWREVMESLHNMVQAVKEIRRQYQ
ncbi:5-methyltetrahydropteroyltriglutamate/homocysteine S-methyltransferase [Denitrovibrio acetiphilus DSM 12809]|uniref:5-methyltetrahydropteroyltriglutamate--homocysteine methyltransferase n=1 Tax=Denitrovibrio acetiphilus (strain DSM 12809 / NBRC 114555 / N2460) TaxID=522772 RepID=D4H8Q1_DENA2|nr:5-methyltetrahydropteroyltriglutamate--homocysteine S-methyltransferase [Denitrovibrio acetiphilus]ADD68400.1 5-methyltetrahydropteroyltriglutamate/homocysteine S-methyltransferase [Denitrovibrio acetiphilus DSM 12809]